MQILVIDDDPAILSMLESVLSDEGHSVVVCERGGQAIHKALQADFELVVCDLSLPDVHGLDLIRAIKAQSPHVPIIVVSALDPAEWEQETSSAGATRYLQKPVRLEDLRREVSLCARSQARLYALVFDTDELHRNRLRTELLRRGSTAVALERAAELEEEGRPGLLLVDARHPEAESILAWARSRAVPAFTYADAGAAVDDDALMRAGAALVLSKPVDVEALLVQARFLAVGGPW